MLLLLLLQTRVVTCGASADRVRTAASYRRHNVDDSCGVCQGVTHKGSGKQGSVNPKKRAARAMSPACSRRHSLEVAKTN